MRPACREPPRSPPPSPAPALPSTSTPSPPTGARSTRSPAPAVETGAVVKADAYGLGAARVGPALAAAGARSFFVALAEEGASLREALGPGPAIYVFAGLMPGDAAARARASTSCPA